MNSFIKSVCEILCVSVIMAISEVRLPTVLYFGCMYLMETFSDEYGKNDASFRLSNDDDDDDEALNK